MLVAIIPLVIAIVGLLMYVLASNAKVAEVGRILFWTGSLATLIASASHVIRVG